MKTLTARFGLTWRTAKEFAGSPFARPVALIPALGYFVLYSQAFSDFFAIDDISQRGYLFLSPIAKSHCLYFGSILIAIGFGFYLRCCPEDCRRHSTAADALEEFTRNGRPHMVFMQAAIWMKNIGRGAVWNNIVDETRAVFFAVLDRLPQEHVTEIASKLRGLVAAQDVPIGAVGSPVDSVKGAINKTIDFMEKKRDAVMLSVLVPTYVDALKLRADDPNARLLCGDLFVRFFLLSQKSKPMKLMITLSFFGLGTIIFLLPTLDVFGQIVASLFGIELAPVCELPVAPGEQTCPGSQTA